MTFEISENIFLEYSIPQLIDEMKKMSDFDRRAIFRLAVCQNKKDVAHAIADAYEIDGSCIFQDFDEQYRHEQDLRAKIFA